MVRGGDGAEQKRGKKKCFCFFLLLNPRPGPDGPRASGWYGRLRELISPFSVLNSDQPWQLFSLGWTILLSIVIYILDSGIAAKYSKRHTSFYSMQVSFRFHSLRCSEILVSPSICTKIRTRRFHRTEEVSNNFSVSWQITHISMTISTESGTRYQPQFYKFCVLPYPRSGIHNMIERNTPLRGGRKPIPLGGVPNLTLFLESRTTLLPREPTPLVLSPTPRASPRHHRLLQCYYCL